MWATSALVWSLPCKKERGKSSFSPPRLILFAPASLLPLTMRPASPPGAHYLELASRVFACLGPCKVSDGPEEQVIASDGATQKQLRTWREGGLQKEEFCASQEGFRARPEFQMG